MSSTIIELEIQKCLTLYKDPRKVAVHLLSLSTKEELSQGELRSLALYFLNSGLYSFLFRLTIWLMYNNKPLFWSILLQALSKIDLPLAKEFANHFSKTLQNISSTEDSVLNYAWEVEFPVFKEAREKWLLSEKNHWELLKKKLLNKLLLARDEQLLDIEVEVFSQLEKMDPLDPQLYKLKDEFENKQALTTLAKQGVSKSQKKNLINYPPPLTEEQKSIIHCIKNEIINIVRSKSEHAFNLSMLFYFLELPDEALAILESSTSCDSTEWFQLDLLLQARRFLEAIEKTHYLEIKYNTNPDSTFAAFYARALAYKGLNQKNSAIKLLEKIVQLRPNYRSAQSLLQEWIRE